MEECNPVTLIDSILVEIDKVIEEKTSWGKNELKVALYKAVAKAQAKFLEW